MKIVDLRLHPVAVARQYATLTSGGQEGRQNPDAVPVNLSYFYILELETDSGIVGIGEISDIDPKMRLGDGSSMEIE